MESYNVAMGPKTVIPMNSLTRLFFLLLLPFSIGKLVEFGFKLQEFDGLQDKIVFGYVLLPNLKDSIKFKEIVSKCVDDYLNSEVRVEQYLTGNIQTIQPRTYDGDVVRYGLIGDIYHLQLYLLTMITSFYRNDKKFRINFFAVPLLNSNRRRVAKIGEIVTIDIDCIYTDYDEDILLNYLVRLGKEGRSSDGSSSTNSGVKTALLPKKKFSSDRNEKGPREKSICDCCTIS